MAGRVLEVLDIKHRPDRPVEKRAAHRSAHLERPRSAAEKRIALDEAAKRRENENRQVARPQPQAAQFYRVHREPLQTIYGHPLNQQDARNFLQQIDRGRSLLSALDPNLSHLSPNRPGFDPSLALSRRGLAIAYVLGTQASSRTFSFISFKLLASLYPAPVKQQEAARLNQLEQRIFSAGLSQIISHYCEQLERIDRAATAAREGRVLNAKMLEDKLEAARAESRKAQRKLVESQARLKQIESHLMEALSGEDPTVVAQLLGALAEAEHTVRESLGQTLLTQDLTAVSFPD